MRRVNRKIVLPILCSVVLLLGIAGSLLAGGSRVSPAEAVTPKTVAEILEQDGYLEGIWYPWFTHSYLGSGLTAPWSRR